MSQTERTLQPADDPHALTTGERLHLLRKRKGLSTRELGEAVGKTHAAISGYERGDHEPGAYVLAKIARELGTSTDYLLGLRHSSTPSKSGGKPRPRPASPVRPIQPTLAASLVGLAR